jgi:hypothetical protein
MKLDLESEMVGIASTPEFANAYWPPPQTECIHKGVCDLLDKAHRDWKNEADSLRLQLKVVSDDRDSQSRIREEVLKREIILREDYQSLLMYSRELLRRFERNWQEIVRVQQGLALTGWFSVEALDKEPVQRV